MNDVVIIRFWSGWFEMKRVWFVPLIRLTHCHSAAFMHSLFCIPWTGLVPLVCAMGFILCSVAFWVYPVLLLDLFDMWTESWMVAILARGLARVEFTSTALPDPEPRKKWWQRKWTQMNSINLYRMLENILYSLHALFFFSLSLSPPSSSSMSASLLYGFQSSILFPFD